MKKNIYLLIGAFVLISQQLSATNYTMEHWEEVHKKASQGDHESAYQLGIAWEDGNQGLDRNMYKALLSHICAHKKGNEKSYDEVIKHYESYFNLAFKAISDTDVSGASLICFGIYQYKGFVKNETKELEKNINKALLLFQEPIKLEQKRQNLGKETNPFQRKWVGRAYTWLGVMLYKKEVTIKELSCLSWEELNLLKGSSSTEIAHSFFEKAIELGNHTAKKHLTIVKQQMEIERQTIEENDN